VIVEFRKWGNSLAVRIPKVLANAVKARDGKRVELTVNGDMTRKNVPQEMDWGPPRGTEIW
jgi:antitoxin MazE